MTNTPTDRISDIVAAQRQFFAEGATLDLRFRIDALKILRDAIKKWERPLADALWQDLHKSYEEAYLTELSIVLGEIDNHLRHLRRWAAPERRRTPLKLFPSSSRIITEPLGTVLIVAPWNYPVQLLLNPLVGAISAGCTAVLKPSPYTPHVAQTLEAMLREAFADSEQYIAVVQGNREVNTALFEERFDLIFLTGSPALGRIAMNAAAHHLTPVVLELGGKSPCIVDSDADIALAARRIAWGKCLNAGQTCIAPDYVLVHRDRKQALVEALAREFKALLGDDPQQSKHYVRIVNERAFDRLTGYLEGCNILCGGRTDRSDRYIEPTVIDGVTPVSAVIKEEIFGPILPILTFDATIEAIYYVRMHEKPLALYYFGSKRRAKEVLRLTSSGGACINDTIMHIANDNIPFGGVGNSGMSAYHGRDSFLAFSHRRSVVSTPTWIDLPFRYMPYKWWKMVKRLL